MPFKKVLKGSFCMNVLSKIDHSVTGSKGDRSQGSINRGFTILELMITIVIIGILTTVALPSMRDWVIYNRVRSQADDIVSLLDVARTTSIEMGQPAFITGWTKGGNNAPFASPIWDESVIALVDNKVTGIRDEVGFLHVKNTSIRLQARANGIVFLPNGMSGLAADNGNRFIQFNGNTNIVILVCEANGNKFDVATITMTVTGATSVQMTKADNNQCLIQD